MHRPICAPLVLAVAVFVGLLAPATTAATSRFDRPIKDIVTFVSRAELQRQGLIAPTASGGGSVRPQAFCLFDCVYVANRRYVRTTRPFVTLVQGNGPATIAIDLTRTVKNSFSANVSVSGQVVSAGVGFNVERSESVTYRASAAVPAGACWTLRASNVFFEYSFEVWIEPFIGPDKKIGTGTARDFQGVEFRLSKSC